YRRHAALDGEGRLHWVDAPKESGDRSILRGAKEPFRADGGLCVLDGNLGRAAIKVSAVPQDRLVIEAPARVFTEQDQLKQAFERGELERDFVAVVRFQGPRANGMPELHQLTPILGVLQDRGHRVALLTDGRMSGASGRIPAAIHLTPEASAGGPIARLRDGDLIRIDATAGTLDVMVPASEWDARPAMQHELEAHRHGLGRELFSLFRRVAEGAEHGAGVFPKVGEEA